MKTKRSVIELEEECKKAHELGLLDDFSYNPFISRPYMLIRFHKNTTLDAKVSVCEYIKINFRVLSAEFVSDTHALYVVYDFWDRQP